MTGSPELSRRPWPRTAATGTGTRDTVNGARHHQVRALTTWKTQQRQPQRRTHLSSRHGEDIDALERGRLNRHIYGVGQLARDDDNDFSTGSTQCITQSDSDHAVRDLMSQATDTNRFDERRSEVRHADEHPRYHSADAEDMRSMYAGTKPDTDLE